MALIRADRVLETSTTTGTGALTLAGAVLGYRAFSSVMATSDTCYYVIEAIDAQGVPTGDWEAGLGTYSGTNTLTRTTVHASSNANSAVSFAAGTKRVFIDITATAAGALGGSSGALILLEQHTASSSATLDFTTCISSTYDEYLIEIVGLVPATNAVNFTMRMSTDGGSTYDSGANYSYNASGLNHFGVGASGADSGAGLIRLNNSGIDNTSTAGVNGSLRLFNPGSTSLHKNVMGQINILTGGVLESEVTMGWYRSTTAVNAFTFLFSSGNIASGTIRVYGVAK